MLPKDPTVRSKLLSYFPFSSAHKGKFSLAYRVHWSQLNKFYSDQENKYISDFSLKKNFYNYVQISNGTYLMVAFKYFYCCDIKYYFVWGLHWLMLRVELLVLFSEFTPGGAHVKWPCEVPGMLYNLSGLSTRQACAIPTVLPFWPLLLSFETPIVTSLENYKSSNFSSVALKIACRAELKITGSDSDPLKHVGTPTYTPQNKKQMLWADCCASMFITHDMP